MLICDLRQFLSFILHFAMGSDHPPDSFLPNAVGWTIHIMRKSKNTEKSIAIRKMNLPQPLTDANVQSLATLIYTEEDKLIDLFSALGTEGFRRFRMKTGWEPEK